MRTASKPGSGKKRASQEERKRLRLHQARAQFAAHTQTRRRRDNLIAVIAGGAIVLGALASQAVYFTAGPGLPQPTAPAVDEAPSTDAPTPESTDSATETPTPEATQTPTPSASPSTGG